MSDCRSTAFTVALAESTVTVLPPAMSPPVKSKYSVPVPLPPPMGCAPVYTKNCTAASSGPGNTRPCSVISRPTLGSKPCRPAAPEAVYRYWSVYTVTPSTTCDVRRYRHGS